MIKLTYTEFFFLCLLTGGIGGISTSFYNFLVRPKEVPVVNCNKDTIALQGCEHANHTLNRQLDNSQLELERQAQKLDTCEEILFLRSIRKR